MNDEHATDDSANEIGWFRAIVTGVALLIVGIGVTVVGGNRILTKALAVTRGGRETLATALFLVVLVALAWLLRTLQARGMI